MVSDLPNEAYYLRYSTIFDMTFMFWRRQELLDYLHIHLDFVQGWKEDIWAWSFLGRYRLNLCEEKHSAIIDAVVVYNPLNRSHGHREAPPPYKRPHYIKLVNAAHELLAKNGIDYETNGHYTTGGKFANTIPGWIKHEIDRCKG